MSLMNYRGLVFKRMFGILAVVLLLGGVCNPTPTRNSTTTGSSFGGRHNSATTRISFKHCGGRERGCCESGY
jgi:hypothetical protein